MCFGHFIWRSSGGRVKDGHPQVRELYGLSRVLPGAPWPSPPVMGTSLAFGAGAVDTAERQEPSCLSVEKARGKGTVAEGVCVCVCVLFFRVL